MKSIFSGRRRPNMPNSARLSGNIISAVFGLKLMGIALLVIVSTGCRATFVPPPGYVAAPRAAAEACRIVPWQTTDRGLLLRQTVFLDIRGHSQVMEGLMMLAPDLSDARLVGMSEFGIKLFDMSLRDQAYVIHSVSPALGKKRGFLARWVAESVQRIFLPGPLSSDSSFYVGPETVFILDQQPGARVLHECDQPTGRVVRSAGLEQGWEAEYAGFETQSVHDHPRLITYQDQRSGYRLTLVIHEVSER